MGMWQEGGRRGWERRPEQPKFWAPPHPRRGSSWGSPWGCHTHKEPSGSDWAGAPAPPPQDLPWEGPFLSPCGRRAPQCPRAFRVLAVGLGSRGSLSPVPSPRRCRASLPQGHWGPSQAGGQESGPWGGGLSLSSRGQPSATIWCVSLPLSLSAV